MILMSKEKVFIGIDNGILGAVAILSWNGKTIILHDMPIIQKVLKGKTKRGNEKKRNVYDEVALAKIMRDINEKYNIVEVLLEEAIAMPGQASTATGSTFGGYGFIKGVCAALKLPYSVIHPRTWSVYYFKGNSGNDKSKSMQYAKQLFLEADFMKGKNVHDGRTDAALIAEYSRRRYTMNLKGA